MSVKDVCEQRSPEELPNVIHYCQRYALGQYFFGKRRLPGDFLTCQSALLAEPPTDIAEKYDYGKFPGGDTKKFSPQAVKRNAFAVCYLISAVNNAATYFKQHHCDPGTANFNKTMLFN
jgi:hypothetical protein